MNKKARKLNLTREVLRTVAANELNGIAGGVSGLNGSSENCTLCCPGTGPKTFCFCINCETLPPACGA